MIAHSLTPGIKHHVSLRQEPAANAAWANKGDKDAAGNDDKEGTARDGAGKILYKLNGQSLEIPLHAADCDLRNFPHKV